MASVVVAGAAQGDVEPQDVEAAALAMVAEVAAMAAEEAGDAGVDVEAAAAVVVVVVGEVNDSCLSGSPVLESDCTEILYCIPRATNVCIMTSTERTHSYPLASFCPRIVNLVIWSTS